MEDKVKANKQVSNNESLFRLGLRPVSAVFHQVRYWSALDDPQEEKWDYISHYTRTERRERGITPAPSFNFIPIIAVLLVLLLFVGVGTGGLLAWPYIRGMIDGAAPTTQQTEMNVVTGYMVHLGVRDLGVIRDRTALETFISDWLAQQNAASQQGVTYVLSQSITYDEVLIDAPYCASLEDVQNAFIKHATLDIAQ